MDFFVKLRRDCKFLDFCYLMGLQSYLLNLPVVKRNSGKGSCHSETIGKSSSKWITVRQLQVTVSGLGLQWNSLNLISEKSRKIFFK